MRPLVDAHHETNGVEPVCRVLQIAPSGSSRTARPISRARIGHLSGV